MKSADKALIFKKLDTEFPLSIEEYYSALEKCGDLAQDYHDDMTTQSINCDAELERLPTADYNLCCTLLTMLLREDHFSNGSFERRFRMGQVTQIIRRIIYLLCQDKPNRTSAFSEMALQALGDFYVYALVDPRDDKVFYIGKGTENRVFAHEAESAKSAAEKHKLQRIRDIENSGFGVKRLIINWGLTESEAFAAEAALINMLNIVPGISLTNEVAGHHTHQALTAEEFELIFGAQPLKPKDINHNILVIKINKLYRRGMSSKELYDSIRGNWRASMASIGKRNIEYVFGVYNQLIVAVYKPDEWHYVHERIDVPQIETLDEETLERGKNRVYFVCKDYETLDENQRFYLHKSISKLKINQSAQNPISYLSPEK